MWLSPDLHQFPAFPTIKTHNVTMTFSITSLLSNINSVTMATTRIHSSLFVYIPNLFKCMQILVTQYTHFPLYLIVVILLSTFTDEFKAV